MYALEFAKQFNACCYGPVKNTNLKANYNVVIVDAGGQA
jgi:hypothetical protein